MIRYLCFVVLLSISLPSFASVVRCGSGAHDVELLSVQGDREGVHGHENKLILQLSDNGTPVSCSGNTYGYVENTNTAFPGILSALLAAQASGKKVEVYVNSGNTVEGSAVEISWVTIRRQN